MDRTDETTTEIVEGRTTDAENSADEGGKVGRAQCGGSQPEQEWGWDERDRSESVATKEGLFDANARPARCDTAAAADIPIGNRIRYNQYKHRME